MSSKKAITFTHFVLPSQIQPLILANNRRAALKHCNELVEQYVQCESIGLAYIFISEGYDALLSWKKPFRGVYTEMLLREALDRAREKFGKKADKIKIIGSVPELVPILAEFSWRLERLGPGHKLGELLLGHGERVTYDSPKIVEAIIRLARNTTFGPEPIFRFDADVTVEDEGIQHLLDFYKKCTANDFYFFSGGYKGRDASNTRDDLFNSFAVRVAQFYDHETDDLDIDESRRFLAGLVEVGADPYHQVISGAGLCMSPSAIRELPPFANAGDMIIWIDDHLKRILHEDLQHFPKKSWMKRCDDALFIQDRYEGTSRKHENFSLNKDFAAWHRNGYLERLVRGCLMDAAIQKRGEAEQGIVAEWIETRLLPNNTGDISKGLRETLLGRLEKIRDLWKANHRGTSVADFADKSLAAGGREGRGKELVDEVIQDVDDYFHLLRTWGDFVALCEKPHSLRKSLDAWLMEPCE